MRGISVPYCEPCRQHERPRTLSPRGRGNRRKIRGSLSDQSQGSYNGGLYGGGQLNLDLVAFVGEASLYAGAYRRCAGRDPGIP
jgi:hypothetical protein